MSGQRVDVLAVLDYIAHCDYIPVSTADLNATRAAVAELIEAANGVIASYRFESPDHFEVLVKVDQDTLLRMCAAIANVGSAS